MAGRRHFGAYRKLPSGRWQAKYRVAGKLLPAPRTFSTRNEAARWLSSVVTPELVREWYRLLREERSASIAAKAYTRAAPNPFPSRGRRAHTPKSPARSTVAESSGLRNNVSRPSPTCTRSPTLCLYVTGP